MLKFLRWLGGLALTLALLILLAVIVLPNVVDPNDYKDELSDIVKDKTGRNLSLNGDLTITVFPWLGVKTQGLTLSQPVGIDGDMVSVDTAQLRVKLAPLLSKKVEVDTVVFERPMIKLVTLKSGLDSFSGLSDEGADEAQDDSATAVVALAIQGVEISEGTVVIDDRQEGSVTEFRNLNLTTGNLIGDSLAEVRATGELLDSTSPDRTIFDLTTKALINTNTFELSAVDVVALIRQGEYEFEVASQTMSYAQNGQVELSGIEFFLKGEQSLQARVPKLVANIDSQIAAVESIDIEYENVKALVSNLSVKKFIDLPSATGRLEIPSFDARELVKTFELDFEPSDSQVLKAVGLKADFAGSLEGALVQNLVINLDNTELSGSASVVNFEKPKLKFDLNLSDLNLDSYLPEDVEGEDEVSGGEALAVPMALFKGVDANGTFKANKLVSGGVALTHIDVIVKSTPGNVSITPRAKLYEGKLDGAIEFKQLADTSSLRVKNDIDLVQLSPLLRDAIDSEQLRGIGTLGLDLIVTEKNGVQSNEGTIELRASNGALSGIDVYDIIGKLNNAADLYSRFSGDEQPKSDDAKVEGDVSDNTEFSELLGTFYLKDFLMTNDDLKFKGPGFEITGAGQFDLEKESIDYRVNLIIQESISRVGGEGVQKLLGSKLSWLGGKQIPIQCRGSFESPVCLPDVNALYSFYLSSKVNEKKSELLQEKLGIKVEEGKKVRTKDILKQLILKEVIKDDEPESGLPNDSREVPIGERDGETNSDDDTITETPVREKTKKELRDERTRKLLESIFD